MLDRLSEYRIMWILVFFDLPTESRKDIKAYALFRKSLIKDGFTMYQESVYVRNCGSMENCNVHVKRVTAMLPQKGSVSIMCITDKQFGDIKVFYGAKEQPPQAPGQQLDGTTT